MSVEYFNRVRGEMNQVLWDGVDERGLSNNARIGALRIFFREMVRAFEIRDGGKKGDNVLSALELGILFFGLGWLEEHGGNRDGYEPTMELVTYDEVHGQEVGASVELADLAFGATLADLLEAGVARGYRHNMYVLMLEALPEKGMNVLVGAIVMALANEVGIDEGNIPRSEVAGIRRTTRLPDRSGSRWVRS